MTDSTRRLRYAEGADYRVEGREIVAMSGSRIPTMHDFVFPKGEYPWLSVAGRHVLVTYSHDDRWSGPTVEPQAARLPHSLAKLRSGKPVTIVAYGDSITAGINVSGHRGDPPYMPTWVELFERQLGWVYRNKQVHVFNAALSGMTAQWGVDNARDAVASLNPDLVLIAFGMNDFWSVEPADFQRQIAAIMATVRAQNPHAEFILIASIRFDPDYTKEATYVDHLSGYAEALRRLVGKGVAFLDMTDISDALYREKGAKSLMADPMHPDDFLARWYAQGLVEVLSGR